METIQVVLDTPLLRAADRAARKMKRNRSALIREALQEHLQRLEVRTQEEQDRLGYQRKPDTTPKIPNWEAEIVWPRE